MTASGESSRQALQAAPASSEAGGACPDGPCPLRSKGEALRAAFWVALVMVAFLAVQAWWEGHTELAFPDIHSADGNDSIRSALEFRDLFRGDGWFTTGRSVCNPVAGAAMALWGPEASVARLSQVPFVLGVLGIMAGIGWRYAGRRGAILMALGAATSPWSVLFLRHFTRAPVCMFAVAATVLLLLVSRNLTRPWACVLLGGALGLGWLADLSFPLAMAPLALLTGGRGLWESRRARFAMLTLLSAVTLLALLLADGSAAPARLLPLSDGALQKVVMNLWMAPLLVALWVSRGKPWTAGAGLAVSVSVAGLLASPYHLYYMEFRIQELLTALVEQNSPFFGGFWTVGGGLEQYACWLNGFYTGGYLWLVPGSVLLALWKPTRGLAATVGPGFLGALAILSYAVPPIYARYLAPLLPLALLLGFLWAARWRASYVACLAFMLAVGPLQVLGTMPPLQGALQELGVSTFLCDHPWHYERWPRLRWGIPSAWDPLPTPSVLEQVPRGARVGLVLVQAQDTQRFYLKYLGYRFRVVRLPVTPRLELGDAQYVVVVAPRSWELPGDPRLERLGTQGPDPSVHPFIPEAMVFPRVYARRPGS